MKQGLLRDIRQDGISATESNYRRLAKEEPFLKQGMIPSLPKANAQRWRYPERQPDDNYFEGARPGGFGMWRGLRFVVQDRVIAIILVALDDIELILPELAPEQTSQSGNQDNGRKRHLEEEDGDEGKGGNAPHDRILQRLAANAN